MHIKMSAFSLTDIFELKCLVENVNVKLNCRVENGVKQLLAIVTNDGDIVLHYTYGEMPAVLKRIPWLTDSNKAIQAVCFDPTATWLLVICLDTSLYIVPALSLVDKKQKIDCKWSVNDVTYFPKHSQTPDSKPLCIVWWQTLECNQNALVGHENGAIGLISLTDGRCLGFCNIAESVTHMHLCQDNSLDSVSLLINSSSGQQYRLVLEQPSTGYLWPPEISYATDDSTRSRLYSLKQMGVDKFFLLKQRISESRNIRRDSQASDSTSESSHSDHSTNSGPELLPRLCDTYFAPQYARNRYLFSAFYKPTSLLTVHASDVESAPLYVHKLPQGTNSLLLTDRLIYITNDDQNILSIISTQLSECSLEGDSEFNPNSLVAQFKVQKNSEKILNVYKVTDVTLIKERRTKEDSKKDKEKTFLLPKTVNDLSIRKVKIDTCVIITNYSVYRLIVSCSPINKFIELVNEDWNLEKAEYLSIVFSLNLQQLLESCGDILISNSSFHQGLILFKQAKVHLLKRVLKFAVSADCKALLKFVNLCLNASKVDMSVATKIHIGNLAVMAYTELVLRYGGHLRVINTKEFMNFLYYEEFYDQVLAVNVACQAGHWNVVALLSKSRGLQPEVVAALSQILQSSRISRAYDREFLLTLSEPTLTQSLLIYPSYCQIILSFVKANAQNFPPDILQRFAAQLDPSQPSALPIVSKLFQRTKFCSSLDSTLDSLDFDNTQQVPMIREFVETFIIVLIVLIEKDDNVSYNLDLLENVKLPPYLPKTKEKIPKFSDLHPLSCGYEHAGVIRNNAVYTMGIASSGCLGLGPLLTHSSSPRLVQTITDLRIKVLSISCGRKHTLVLTDFGIYAWGSNSYGQLGIGQCVRETPYPQILQFFAGVCIVDVVAGQYHSMALSSSGEVYTWGWGIHGQLGHDTCNNEFLPKLLAFKFPVMQMAAGHAHSLILTTEGKLFGFGSNTFGQLENCNIEGSKVTKPTWVIVMPDIYTPIEKIATAYFHNICVRADQEVYTWGANPQEMRISQSKSSQKLVGLGTKLYEPWKNSTHIYTGINQKPIEQVAVGFRHSVVLHNGKLLWNKSREGELSSPKMRDQDSLSVLNQRFLYVSCGPDYIMAMEHTGKILAWGNNTMAQTLLGKLYEDNTRQDGKIMMFKNTKRIVKFPTNMQTNGEAYPVEVPCLPTMAITYSPSDHRVLFTRNHTPYAIRSIENNAFQINCDINSKSYTKASLSFDYLQEVPRFKFGPKTLHYVLETYYGCYDSENTLSKCIDVNNYQAASKIALLDGHYSDSLGFQLHAFKKYMDTFHLDLSPIEIGENDTKKMDSNKVDLNNIKFEFNFINSSPAHILSASSSLDSIRQWGDDLEHQGGCESPCEMTELGDVRQSVTQYVQSIKSDSPPISSVSKMIADNTVNEESKIVKESSCDLHFKDKNTKEVLRMASQLIEFYIKKTYASENHILMQNILLKCIDFWLSNNLPVSILEEVLLKNMDKYFYPLSILLFCKNLGDEEVTKKDEDVKHQKSAGFLKEFSTKFCLQLCSMVLENVNKA